MKEHKKHTINQQVYNNTSQALCNLIDNCIISKSLRSITDVGGIKAYLKEYCTIKLCGPRRSGHSHALVSAGLEYFNLSEKSSAFRQGFGSHYIIRYLLNLFV